MHINQLEIIVLKNTVGIIALNFLFAYIFKRQITKIHPLLSWIAGYIVSFPFNLVITIITIRNTYGVSWSMTLEALLISETIRLLFFVLFVYGVVISIVKSITIQLLLLIIHATSGIHEKDISRHVDKKNIIDQRIHDLVAAGQIKKQKNIYMLNSTFTLYKFRHYVNMAIDYLFPKA